jgi:REP element-mobilizing transposase RayT
VKYLRAARRSRRSCGGGQFWSDGYFIASVGQHGNEHTIGNYVREQGSHNQYQQLHAQQMMLFDTTP